MLLQGSQGPGDRASSHLEAPILAFNAPEGDGAHPVLDLPELLLHIFQDLSLKDLMASALTCRAWFEIATSMLWGTFTVPVGALLSTLAPIVRPKRYHEAKKVSLYSGIDAQTQTAVESSIARIVDSLEHARTLDLSLPITRQGWTRFLSYSHKIRTLLIDVVLDAKSVALLRDLLTESQSTLCSTVQSMEVRARGCHGWTNMVHLFLPISTISLNLNQGRGVGEGWRILEHATFTAPDIRSLTIRDRDPRTYTAFESLSPTLKKLRRVHFGDITQGGWKNLEQAEHLVDLTLVSAVIPQLWQKAIVDNTDPTFAALKRLVIIRSYDTEAFFNMLCKTMLPALRLLIFDASEGLHDPSEFLRHLSCNSPELDELDIEPPDIHIPSVLASISLFPRLRRLRISPPCNITDQDVATLAQGLPLLEQLRLLEYASALPQMSEGALDSVISYCEWLTDLRISVRFRRLSSNLLASPHTTSRRLERLDLHIWGLPEAWNGTLALFLALLAPDVRALSVAKCPPNQASIMSSAQIMTAVADFQQGNQRGGSMLLSHPQGPWSFTIGRWTIIP
ncbi:hypothetical protein FRB98_004572 [Tulasnella sp. 332]|nr:hypothetical protein FRB98_004572 [Tulasnella sp. 332]